MLQRMLNCRSNIRQRRRVLRFANANDGPPGRNFEIDRFTLIIPFIDIHRFSPRLMRFNDESLAQVLRSKYLFLLISLCEPVEGRSPETTHVHFRRMGADARWFPSV